MLHIARLFPVVVLLAGCAGSPVSSSSSGSLPSTAALSQRAAGPRCPKYRQGSGILNNGDFHQSADPASYLTYAKGKRLATDWQVTVLNVDFVGTSFWNFDHLCSVDLDGESAVGGIAHHPFRTKKGAKYALSFLMSGNSYCGPIVKKMRVVAGNETSLFTWDVSSNHDVEHGVVAARRLNFKAVSSASTLAFTSLDTAGSGCGPVIGAVSVTKG